MRIANPHKPLAIAVALWMVAFVAFSPCHSASASNAILNLQQIQAGVAQERAKIHRLDVTVVQELHSGVASAIGFEHRRIAFDDQRFYVDRNFSAFGKPEKIFHTVASFDGKQSLSYFGVTGCAALQNGPANTEFSTHGGGMFDLMMYFPCVKLAGNAAESLESLLSSSAITVEPELETINGFECHVLSVSDSNTGDLHQRLWVDHNHGFLPIRQRYYGPKAPDDISLEYSIDAVIESGGTWFPSHGWRTAPADPSMPELALPISLEISIEGWQNGHPAIVTNGALPDDLFSYLDDLPAGVMVTDMGSGESWIASSTNFDQAARVAVASCSTLRDAVDQRLDGSSESGLMPTVVNPLWIGLMLASVTLSSIWFFRRR